MRTQVVPDSRELEAIPDRPGYYIISAGYLREIFGNLRVCERDLELCLIETGSGK